MFLGGSDARHAIGRCPSPNDKICRSLRAGCALRFHSLRMIEGEIEQHLVTLGVPGHVAAFVSKQRPWRIPWVSQFGSMVVMVGGFAFGGLWLWPTLKKQLDQNALAAARSSGALLYHHNFGIGLLIALFAWIGASSLIVGAIPMLSHRLMAGEFYASVTGAAASGNNLSGRAARWGVKKMLRKLENEPDPLRYIRRAVFAWMKPASGIVAIGLALAAFVTFRELNAYALYFADHYEEQHTFLPAPTVRAWSDAVRVEVGCNHITGKNAGDDPVYSVHFSDGGSTRIDGTFPVSKTWLDQVEVIDAALVRRGVRFEPWSWLGRDPYHPRCLMAYANWLGDEKYSRFQRLIRAPTLPRDVMRD